MLGDAFPLAAGETVGDEIEEGAVLVAHFSAALGSVESSTNIGVLAGGEIPRAGNPNYGSVRQLELAENEILALVRAGGTSILEQPRASGRHFGEIEQPQRQIDKMDSQVDQAAAAGQRRIVKPAITGPVGIVERQVGGEWLPQRAGGNEAADRLHRRGVAVGEIHSKKPVGVARGVEHGLDFAGVAAERLLAEHGDARVQRFDTLFGVKRARSSNHHPARIEREHVLERADSLRIGSEGMRFGGGLGTGVADRDRLGLTGAEHGFHPVAADPAGAEKAEPDHVVTTAFTKPSGRSRVASKASPSWSSL
jgi:hypothetical protein